MKANFKSFEDKVHFYGRISLLLALVGTALLPLILWLKFGLLPTKAGFFAGATTLLSIMIPASIAEFLSYAPLVGAAGYYTMAVTGNFSNIKIPSSIIALNAVNLKPETEEGEIISTLAITLSAITTVVIIAVGVVLMTPFAGVFNNPALKPAFEQIVPSLFGALILISTLKNPKAVIVPVIVATIIIKFQLVNPMFSLPVIIFVSLLLTWRLYKLDVYTPKAKEMNVDSENCR